MLRRRSSTDQHAVPVRRDGDRFTIVVDATAMPSFGDRLPLRDGIWDIGMRPAGGQDRAAAMTPAYDHARLAEVADLKTTFGPEDLPVHHLRLRRPDHRGRPGARPR